MIEIVSYKDNPKGARTGFCCIKYIPKVKIFTNNIALFEKNGKRWAAMPSITYESKEDNKVKFYPLLGFDERENKEIFDKELFKALNEFRQKSSSNTAEQFECPF